jgi:hypothetical protein
MRVTATISADVGSGSYERKPYIRRRRGGRPPASKCTNPINSE